MGDEVLHQKFMARALQLARRGLYTTDPNPRVGCVLVKDGQIIAEGWHQKAGRGHAEVEALSVAGENAQGATAYVTLEPCSHTGKTPPCADKLIAAGVAEVVTAMQDPNPQVSGQGHEKLRQAGIKVTGGVLEQAARELNPGFIRRMEQGLPYVRCKMAMSLDGRTAMASGESKWITGSAARSDVQRLRARSSAIVTGVGTVLADDPAMTLRADELGIANAEEVINHQPMPVVLDSQFQTPPNARILTSANALVVGAQESAGYQELQRKGVETLIISGADQVDLKQLLVKLAAREINEVLVEAGATISGAFLQQDLIDELVIYMAPKLLGNEAKALFNLPGMENMSDQIQLEIKDVRQVGDDLRISAVPKKRD